MKTFLFVLSFILILFGVSIWYYRSSPDGGFKLPKISWPFSSSQEAKKDEEGGVLSDETEKYKSLEIVEGTSGPLNVGQRRVYFAVARLDSGGSVSVNGNWYLSDDKIGILESSGGTETTLKTNSEGSAKLFLSYLNLKTEKELQVGGTVLGSKVTPSPTPTATPKASRPTGAPVSPSPTATPDQPRVAAINIYDADGRRIVVGDSRTFTAKVLFSNGVEKDLEVDWSLSGDLGTLSKVHSSSTEFKALKAGSGTLTVDYQGTSASLSVQVF